MKKLNELRFSSFIINEQSEFLAQKIGDLLTAVQDLRDNGKSMGTRDLTKFSEKIVNQIRRVLHSHWSREQQVHLKVLQKVAVAIMKGIEEKGDLNGIIAGSADTLEKLSGNLGVPLNRLAAPSKAQIPDTTNVAKPEKPQLPIQQQPQQNVAAEPTPLAGAGSEQLNTI